MAVLPVCMCTCPESDHMGKPTGCLKHGFHPYEPVVAVNSARSTQVGGSHYQTASGMQPFDVIDAFELDFYEGNALKYLLRWRKKNGVEDLKKAQHYINVLIERAENDAKS